MSPSERVEYDMEVEKLRAALGKAQFISQWVESRALATEQAISYALELDKELARKP